MPENDEVGRWVHAQEDKGIGMEDGGDTFSLLAVVPVLAALAESTRT